MEEPPHPLRIEIETDPTVNFAMEQNDVPVVKRLHVRNEGTERMEGLVLRLIAEPEFAAPWERRLAALEPGCGVDLGLVDWTLATAYLHALPERVAGAIHALVLQETPGKTDPRDAPGGGEDAEGATSRADAPKRPAGARREIARVTKPIEVLAHDEWSGLRSVPEILAAFVLPNHPVVERLLAVASDVLREWTGDAALSGYQTRSRERVAAIAAALYAAAARMGLRYISAPASFEATGQKIRLPDRIEENRLASCLDLTVLFAALLEQAGLNPLVVVTEGHAFPGVWLDDECFAWCASDDAAGLRKRADLGEILLFESTFVTQTPAPGFDAATAEGRRQLEATEGRRQIENADRFRCVVDIRRARKTRVRPLPFGTMPASPSLDRPSEAPPAFARSGVPASGEGFVPDFSAYANATEVEAARVEEDGGTDVAPAEPPAARLERWKRKLLDLTLHNRLLNIRETKKSLPVLCPDLAALEDALADGDKFRIHPRPVEWSAEQPRDADLHRRRTGEDALGELLREAFRSKRLHAACGENELARRLIEIYRAARASLEESGANTLYLALGFLLWYESPTATTPRRAPLLLVPLNLERRSVAEGFTLRQGDEDPLFNVTLLEMLNRDFGISIGELDPLPRDEHGVDVARVLKVVRQGIKDVPRWDIVEDACIGLFSFAKFLMWRDLQDRTTDLCRSKVVGHLIERPREPYPERGGLPDPAEIDALHPPETTFCPLSADSSQLAAVHAASSGRSFVLEGPPGTGKSQTIANLIAHTLATGKSVLFVAEKMAALEVVRARLGQLGLGPFCLELHSNKSSRKETVEQLEAALEAVSLRPPEDWEREARRLGAAREDLNRFVEAMHRERPLGISLFHAVSRLSALRDVPALSLDWPAPGETGRETLDRCRETIDRLRAAAEVVAHPDENPWRAARLHEWTPALQREIEDHAGRARSALDRLGETFAAAAPLLGLDPGVGSVEGPLAAGHAAEVLLGAPAPPPPLALVEAPDWQTARDEIVRWIERGRRRTALRAEVLARYAESVLALELESLTQKLHAAEAGWGVLRPLRRWMIRRTLRRAANPGQSPSENLRTDIARAIELRDEETFFAKEAETARRQLAGRWQDAATDWDEIERLVEWIDALRAAAARVAGTRFDMAQELRSRWTRMIVERPELLATDNPAARPLRALVETCTNYDAERAALEERLELDAIEAWGDPNAANARRTVARRLDEWVASSQTLRPWCHWRTARDQAAAEHLEPLLAAFEKGRIAHAQFADVFERAFLREWVEAVLEADPAVHGFFGPEHERKIERFRQLDDRYRDLTREEVVARLAARIPVAPERVNENSEMGILRGQLQRKRRHMPIRQLFQKIPHLLARLKPCLLMSPISVAQYLDAAHPSFDLVVFDEASQMPVWDAVGAIARGAETVIVGDPMQLPPTSFFNRGDDEEELLDDDTVEDQESILDDCIAAQLDWLQLQWHYRSRHESLIAFSNRQYYRGRLYTFPSTNVAAAVRWQPVPEGVYDRSKTRANRAEAEAVVREILERLRDPERANQTLGVVTFSLPQQTLVQDLLEQARAENPDIEPFFGEEAEEPVFVKNLENVQGDERDVILFSICYGPDASGRVSMNFGPLNKNGGERRLNVAITRARREVLVFSTLRPEQIDLSRTRAVGVAHLKLYLEYARNGTTESLLSEAPSTTTAVPSRGRDEAATIEDLIAETLERRGYSVRCRVGCSGGRVDVAVLHPEDPERYILGLLCDGESYRLGKTARDRDRLREDILRGLGWDLCRVWSLEWWLDPDATLAKIEKAIETARRGKTKLPKSPKPPKSAVLPSVPEGDPAPASEMGRSSEGTPSREATPPSVVGANPYCAYEPASPPGTPEAFYDSRTDKAVQKSILAVLRHEAPIHADLLMRRVAAHWGFARLGTNILDRIRTQLDRLDLPRSVLGAHVYLWPPGSVPSSYAEFRCVGEPSESRREPHELPPEEIANAARRVLEQQGGLPLDALVSETARLLGFQRAGANLDRHIRLGIERALDGGVVASRGGMLILVSPGDG